MAGEKAKDIREITDEQVIDLLNIIMKRENHGIVEYIDCPLCGGKNTLYYARAIPYGELRGGCTSCGKRFSVLE